MKKKKVMRRHCATCGSQSKHYEMEKDKPYCKKCKVPSQRRKNVVTEEDHVYWAELRRSYGLPAV